MTESPKPPALFRPLIARDRDEPHRASTPLELFFDLVSVVGIATCASAFHHAISAGHGLETLPNFLLLFASIWWAWMNFTWFASAFDNDDLPYRIATMVLIAGAVVYAGAADYGFRTMDFSVGLIGWIIMRLAMGYLWLRVARHNPDHAKTAYRYARGLLFAQILWILLLIFPFGPEQDGLYKALSAAMFSVEIGVVFYAEAAGPTPWHRHHIIERFGLLNIIVLGEIFLTISLAVGYGAEHHFNTDIIMLVITGLVSVFCMWWLYFLSEDHLVSRQKSKAVTWIYGHFFIFAAGAATGAGIGTIVDVISHHSEISMQNAQLAATVPIAIYVLGLWLVRDRHYLNRAASVMVVIAVGVIATSSFFGAGLPITAVVLVLLLAVRLKGSVLLERLFGRTTR